MSRLTWHEYFMEVAYSASHRSTCPRRSVGAVIVGANQRILGTGYNGSLPNEPHCIDVGCLLVNGSCKRTIHAEDNAIKYTKLRERAGSTLYCTDLPCPGCAQLIAKSGIAHVIYDRPYKKREKEIVAIFIESGIVCEKLERTSQLVAIDPE